MRVKFIIALLIFLTGCASVPTQRSDRYAKIISSAGEMSLQEFARRYDFQVDFDPFLKKIYLTKGEDIQIILASQSPVALVNGEVILLDSNLAVKDGDIILSADNAEIIMGYFLYGRKTKDSRYKKNQAIYKVNKIVIDAGHGGKDPGAIGKSGLKEKDVTLSIAKIIKSKLDKAGYDVIMTRDGDEYISLWKRVYIANKEGADLFISIHANAARAKSASGFEVYYLSQATDEDARALAAAENYPLGFNEDFPDDLNVQATIWDLLYSENRKDSLRLAEKISTSLNRKTNARNRGIKSANFYILRGAQMPSILIEAGFISNTNEEVNLKKLDYKNKIAGAVLEGVKLYEREYMLTEGFGR